MWMAPLREPPPGSVVVDRLSTAAVKLTHGSTLIGAVDAANTAKTGHAGTRVD